MKKLALREELVKYIFPGTNPAIALGEDGYIIYDFKSLYPEKLALFIPSEVDRSRYSDVFPRSFEAYFQDADSEIARMSRYYETDFGNNFSGLGVEYIPGRVLERKDNNYVVFRFDELVESRRKTEALCRVKTKDISSGDAIKIADSATFFKCEAASLSGTGYLYWIMPIGDFFSDVNSALAATFFAMIA